MRCKFYLFFLGCFVFLLCVEDKWWWWRRSIILDVDNDGNVIVNELVLFGYLRVMAGMNIQMFSETVCKSGLVTLNFENFFVAKNKLLYSIDWTIFKDTVPFIKNERLRTSLLRICQFYSFLFPQILSTFKCKLMQNSPPKNLLYSEFKYCKNSNATYKNFKPTKQVITISRFILPESANRNRTLKCIIKRK